MVRCKHGNPNIHCGWCAEVAATIVPLSLALCALQESQDYVNNAHAEAVDLYGQYPSRQLRIQGLARDAHQHAEAIAAVTAALKILGVTP